MRRRSLSFTDSLPVKVGIEGILGAQGRVAEFLPATGLAHGHLHEFYSETSDDVSAAGLVACIAIGATARGGGNGAGIIWLRGRNCIAAHGMIQGAGWAELGGSAESSLFVLADDAKSLLRAAHDAVRSVGMPVIVMETQGKMPEMDLTASRRLAFAAEKSGALLLLLRSGAEPVPSAAETRWAISAAPSRPLPANAPGAPAFDIELLRHRSGPAGGRWRMEWDRDQCIFREAALSGAVVPVPARTAIAEKGAERAIPNAA